ncbi:MAG: sugar phosphate isomerase/epimerase [Chloroflexi bacterium]|jgi:protein FrlC|nr:sugar phosphate isomerase/epimerase [Chloroflexota bacterium]
MKLSFNTWAYSSFPVWVPAYPLEETIKRLARIGYDGIEIGAASPHAYPDYLSAERRREIKQVLDDNGIALSSMLPAPGGGPGFNVASPSAEERRHTIEHYKQVVELCAQWGGATVLYVAGWQVFGTSQEQAWEWSREALREIAVTAASYGVTIAVEPTSMDSNLVESCAGALRMMRESEAPNVKVMFDTIHAMYRNEVPSDYVYEMGEHLHHIHLADTDRLPPGAGRGDFVSVIAALKEIGFKGYVTMEIGFNRRDSEPDKVARQAYEYIKPLVGA